MNATNEDGSVSHDLGWQPTADEHRRAYVLEVCPDFTIAELEERAQWVKNGLPQEKAAKTTLRPIK